MAGILPGFDEDAFRDAIEFAQVALAPDDVDEQVTFHFKQSATYSGPTSPDGVPLRQAGATVTRTETGKSPIRIPCSVDYHDADGNETPFGVYAAASHLTVTVLDRYWDDVTDCTHCVVGGNIYQRRRTPPAQGIGRAMVHSLTFVAEDES